MISSKTLTRFLVAIAATTTLVCCGDINDVGFDSGAGVQEQGVKPPQACPAIAIFCLGDYKVKRLANCNQICVPDQGFECSTDDDCGPIYCITSPCEQPICRAHQCVMPTDTPPDPAGGRPCGDKVCGGQFYCCNASCGICAPLDGACIQIACM